MKKTTYLLLAMTVFVVLFASACGGSAAPAKQVAPPAQNQPAQAPVEQPTQSSAPDAAQSFAPACPASASCAAPAVTDIAAETTYCVKKIAYQNIFVDEGVTFEPLDPSVLTCADNGKDKNGKHIIACHGKQLWASELKFTNTACSASALTTDSGKCQSGSGYDAAKNCCAPAPAAGAGSVTVKFNMGACP